jgi:DNA-binding NarL/FixJ family response regulator
LPAHGLSLRPEPFSAAAAATREVEPAVLERLVREILEHACSSPSESLQEVLLDFDLGTSRFVLLRFPRLGASKPSLSPRELEIVRMVSRGLPNKVMADILNISCWTVSTHVRRIFTKLGVTSRAAMVAKMLELSTSNEKSQQDIRSV